MTSMTDTMNNRQKEIILHALGINGDRKVPYRRHFVTGPGSKDFDDCQALVKLGMLADRGSRGGLYGGDHLFLVSPKGASSAGYPLPTD